MNINLSKKTAFWAAALIAAVGIASYGVHQFI